MGKQVMRYSLQSCATKAIRGRNRDGIYDETMDAIYKYAREKSGFPQG